MGNLACCGGKKSAKGNDGSVLDRVISQASNKDDCLLYRLANYKNGGELIDAYNIGGQSEVEKLILEQFGVLMYCDGKGQVINRAEYLRWKFRDQAQVVLPIEASLSPHDPLAKWEDHEACWKMQYRGSLGETLLHVLIICDTKVHTRLARTLLKCFPKLALDIVEGEDYLGASALHLAIAYANNELVQDLVEAGANVAQRALGSFFLPRDQQLPQPAKHTDYEGLAYLGEYPLAWAACCANESVYNLLLENNADPDAQDSFGNMILHMVVVVDKLTKCVLGTTLKSNKMLELSAREFWRYSNITCSAYPLNALDTLLPDGRTNWNSALFIILNGTKEEHLDMLDGGIIQKLLEEKWKTFARIQFLKRLAILALHLLLLSAAVYLRPTNPAVPLLGPIEWNDICRYCAEIGTVMGVLSYVILQQGEEIKNQGLGSFLKQLIHSPDKFIFLLSNLMILMCIPLRLIGDRKTEEAILVFAVPGSWFLLMFFAGAIRLTGPFVTMVYSMITGDMLTFGIIYTVVLFGFSQTFYFLYKGFPGVKSTLYESYPSTWMALFQITMGDYNYPELSYTTYPAVSKTVFAIFMVFVPILLLNMLIAMMGNTYAHVIEQSEKEWMKQWAKIVVALERAVNQSDAHHYLQEYSISLGPSDDPSQEQRGVMIIKSKSKTRAKQRKGALSNWKRVGKVTINELRKRGWTGEQLRRLMWERASISTPVRVVASPDAMEGADAPGIPAFGDALSAALDVMAFANDLDLARTEQDGAKLTVPSTALGPGIPSAPAAPSAPSVPPGPPAPAGAAPREAPLPPYSSLAPPGPAPPAALGALPGRAPPAAPAHATPNGQALGQLLQIPTPTPAPAPAALNVPNLFIDLASSTDAFQFPPKTEERRDGRVYTVTDAASKFAVVDAVQDPLRQLVMASDMPNMETELAVLATAAAKLDGVEEVSPPEYQKLLCPPTIFELKHVGRRPLTNFDSNESDELGVDRPLLGRGSQLRHSRYNAASNMDLFNEEALLRRESSSCSSDAGIDNLGFINDCIPKETDADCGNESDSTRSASKEISFKEKPANAYSRRPKTARPNRVGPASPARVRRGASAEAARRGPRGGDARDSLSSPDPLDAWSTRNIADMNTLLAWNKEGDDSL
ncbi:Inactive, transient receptor potential ion channel [Gryllus bimaculatus]|nr:Inactive, transient receptor potential ion channel [Gryllus bimaculatus]